MTFPMAEIQKAGEGRAGRKRKIVRYGTEKGCWCISTTFHVGYVVATQYDQIVIIPSKAIDVVEAAGSVL